MSVFSQLMMKNKTTEPIVPSYLKITNAGDTISLDSGAGEYRTWEKTYDGLAYCCYFVYQISGDSNVWQAPLLVSTVKNNCANIADGQYPADLSNTPFSYKGKNWYYVSAQSAIHYYQTYDSGRYLLNNGEIFTGTTYDEIFQKAAKALMKYVYAFETIQYIDYIETTGTQWINLDLIPNYDTRVVAKIKVTTTQQNLPVFGCNANNANIYYHLTCYGNIWYYGKNHAEGNGGTYNNVAGTEYEVDFNNNGNIIINNSTIATNIGTNGNGTLSLAMRGKPNSADVIYGIYKYYSFNVYQNGTLVRDLVPIYNATLEQYCLFDRENSKFYLNNGTGTITGGND